MNYLAIRFKNKLSSMGKNNKIIISNVIGAFSIKGIALLLSMFTMPAYIRYFDNEQVLGLWFTMLSILSWILTFDLGIGNGLRNNLVPVIINKDNIKIKKYISSAYICIGIVVLICIGIGTSIFKLVDWNIVFNISDEVVSKTTLNKAVLIIFSGIMIQFLLKLVTSILYAMQMSALTNFISLLNSIIILLYVLLAKTSSIEYNLISLSVAHVVAVNTPLLLTTIFIFTKKLKGCSPSFKYFESEYAKSIMKLGGIFFWVQIMYMILTTTNEFLITWLVDPKYVVEYQIYNKLFTLIGTFFTLGLTPIWSSVTKAVAEEDYIWVNKLFKILKKLTLIAVCFEFIMIIFFQLGINLWLGENSIDVNYVYALVFAVLGSIFIWNGVLSSIANGFGKLKVQAICFTIGTILKIPIAIILVNITSSWIGIIIANIIAMIPYCILEPLVLNKFLNKMNAGGYKNV